MPSTTSLRFPSPPPSPCPWLWRCHACHIWYRLATTRRCLECDHAFCLTEPTTTRSSAKKRKRSGGPCRAEFDYIGWAARGAWRRTLLLNTHDEKMNESYPNNTGLKKHLPTSTITPKRAAADDEDQDGGLLLSHPHRRWLPQSSLTTAWGDEHRALEHGLEQLTDRLAEKKEALYVRRRHNCWLHCDFPSECHHAVYKAQQEGKPVLAKARALDRAYLAMVKEEEEEQRQHQQQKREMTATTGPSGLERGLSEGLKGHVRGYDLRRNNSLMRFSDESSDSDSSDSDYDRDEEEVADISLPDSPPTEDEVVDLMKGQEEPVCTAPPILLGIDHTSLDMDGDYSYTAFKKAAGIDTLLPLACVSSPSSTMQTFEIHVDDDNDDDEEEEEDDDNDAPDVISSAHPPVTSTATVLYDHLPSFVPFKPFSTTTITDTTTTTIQTPLPTSREHSTAPQSPTLITTNNTPTLEQLEQAYSAQAWSPSPSSPAKDDNPTTTTTEPSHRRRRRRRATTASRAENTGRMLSVLGRRTSLPSSTLEAKTTISVFEAWDDDEESDNNNTITITTTNAPGGRQV